MASFKSFLEAVGADAKKVFAWVGSTAGQNTLATGEAVIEAVDPGLAGLINLANTYITEAVKTEALAAAAGQQNGSSAQKAAAVIAAVTPSALAYAKAAGLPTPTATQIASANNAMVAFLNSFPAPTA